MRLNPDCVRDVLLTMEACSFGESLEFCELCESLPDYQQDDVAYTCLKLKEANYLDVEAHQWLGMPMPAISRVNDLTYQGHEFLNSIREASVWEKVKIVGKKAGVSSLRLLGEVAQEIAKNALLSALQSFQAPPS